jgi:hypothetical protein
MINKQNNIISKNWQNKKAKHKSNHSTLWGDVADTAKDE